MFLPKIITPEVEKEKKRLEMIGKRFREEYEETADLIKIEDLVTSDFGLADALEQCFPKLYRHFEKKVQNDWEIWCDEYDAQADPPMDQFHYLRAEI
jgi:hypothetical protein